MTGKIVPLYGVHIHDTCARGDLDEMKEVCERAEAYLAADGDIATELEALKAAIAKLEAGEEG
jgi:uncharacterized protein DUF1843